jgi:hypothetical protein
MDHVVNESKKVYAGTDMEDRFVIFHDGLKQWWEKEAQEYLGTLGFRHRQLCCLGETNEDNHNYRGKVVGDSPEICRGLDSHGFADLGEAITYHCSISSAYDPDDPRRFGMGTPAEVWSTVTRCWEVAPTSERICEDIMRFPEVLDKILERNGCVVPDEFLRTGRRARRADGNGEVKHKPRKRQRKETAMRARPRHADVEAARTALITQPRRGARRE